ncbi:3-methyl-2-oxobutanoate hydroxymethyltransferase [Desulfohalotomaculum tongense]|uniref:3-methyl-2-oxobutanoate hydroxymethyltransferase n=1 Tax=Desulforadius tongensis TaxID=1216062 RepID=UPI00195C1889|nr:3-methyl-2-oxobutanoate hydroxymethyltransferase [Desulforadius tongensis]MBM7856033.1 3-methyl-2-oxobutanoate hydroxymethyltransferase [Desulforadius tongensis]
MTKPVTTLELLKMKEEKQPITMLTAYDYPTAVMVDSAGIDVILVGDSLGNVVLGYDTTVPVTMDHMVHHVQAVTRGVKRALVVADMPFMSYHISAEETMRNAARLLQEGGAKAVKIEGGHQVADKISKLTGAGIPVMGHLGLTPQSVHQMGGYRVQAKTAEAANKLLEDARVLQQAGVFALVLECIPAQLAKQVSEELTIPTIGIGAGADCDGQVLVTHDMLGINAQFKPKFVKRYANLHQDIMQALETYRDEVKQRQFPAAEHSFSMPGEELKKLY